MVIFNKVLVKAILQEYARAADYTEREVLVVVYQGSENYLTLIYYATEAYSAAEKAYEDYKNILKVLKTDTKTIKSNNSVMGIKTPLNITSITL